MATNPEAKREANRIRNARYHEKHRERLAEYRRERYVSNAANVRGKMLEKQYGITAEDFAQMLLDQDGVCAICGLPETTIQNGKVRQLSVDHDHETGRVRGLLCNDCNRGIGMLHDDPDLLRTAADYLER
jgi:hypothetical protein